MLLVRDSFADKVFHGRAEHIPIEEPVAEEPVAEELDFEESNFEMVVRRKMTTDNFILRGQAFGGQSTPL